MKFDCRSGPQIGLWNGSPGWAPTRPRHGPRIGPRSRPLTGPRTGSWIGPGSLGPGQDPRLDPGVAGLGPADWAPDWAPEFSSRPRKIFELISHCHIYISAICIYIYFMCRYIPLPYVASIYPYVPSTSFISKTPTAMHRRPLTL